MAFHRLCSGKIWKSNVKNIFFITFPTLAYLREIMPRGTQVIAQSLTGKTCQQNSPKLEIFQMIINTGLIINILSL